MAEPAIIFEDNHIIVVIKPQNVPCCPDESGDENLLDALKNSPSLRAPAKQSSAILNTNNGLDVRTSSGLLPDVAMTKQKQFFIGLVHRLDRVTGGVMVYAKTSKAASRLSAQIKSGGFEKIYLAAVVGVPKNREGTLINHLLKNESKNVVEIVPAATTGAKRAELSYTVLNKSPIDGANISLVEIKLKTGRSHQIRVQMAGIGCPIFGDVKYGNAVSSKLALWAHKLVFSHPTSGDTMRFIVNPPEEIPWTSFDFDRRAHKTMNGSPPTWRGGSEADGVVK